MKNRITLFIIFCITHCTFYSQNYAKERVSDYIGKELKVREKSDKYGYSSFFIKIDDKTNLNTLDKEHTLFYDRNALGSTYEKLIDKVFICDSVFLISKEIKTNYFLRLKNKEIGTVYYAYRNDLKNSTAENKGMAYFFPFTVIGGLPVCNQISQKVDKFDGVITLNSPYEEPISFTKKIKGTDTTIYCSISISRNEIYTGKGLIILLNDGNKIERPEEKVDYKLNSSSNGFEHSVFFRLSKEEILKLKTSEITDVKMYVLDFTIANGNTIKEYLNCITK
jgi:hypothetical protein